METIAKTVKRQLEDAHDETKKREETIAALNEEMARLKTKVRLLAEPE